MPALLLAFAPALVLPLGEGALADEPFRITLGRPSALGAVERADLLEGHRLRETVRLALLCSGYAVAREVALGPWVAEVEHVPAARLTREGFERHAAVEVEVTPRGPAALVLHTSSEAATRHALPAPGGEAWPVAEAVVAALDRHTGRRSTAIAALAGSVDGAMFAKGTLPLELVWPGRGAGGEAWDRLDMGFADRLAAMRQLSLRLAERDREVVPVLLYANLAALHGAYHARTAEPLGLAWSGRALALAELAERAADPAARAYARRFRAEIEVLVRRFALGEMPASVAVAASVAGAAAALPAPAGGDPPAEPLLAETRALLDFLRTPDEVTVYPAIRSLFDLLVRREHELYIFGYEAAFPRFVLAHRRPVDALLVWSKPPGAFQATQVITERMSAASWFQDFLQAGAALEEPERCDQIARGVGSALLDDRWGVLDHAGANARPSEPPADETALFLLALARALPEEIGDPAFASGPGLDLADATWDLVARWQEAVQLRRRRWQSLGSQRQADGVRILIDRYGRDQIAVEGTLAPLPARARLLTPYEERRRRRSQAAEALYLAGRYDEALTALRPFLESAEANEGYLYDSAATRSQVLQYFVRAGREDEGLRYLAGRLKEGFSRDTMGMLALFPRRSRFDDLPPELFQIGTRGGQNYANCQEHALRQRDWREVERIAGEYHYTTSTDIEARRRIAELCLARRSDPAAWKAVELALTLRVNKRQFYLDHWRAVLDAELGDDPRWAAVKEASGLDRAADLTEIQALLGRGSVSAAELAKALDRLGTLADPARGSHPLYNDEPYSEAIKTEHEALARWILATPDGLSGGAAEGELLRRAAGLLARTAPLAVEVDERRRRSGRGFLSPAYQHWHYAEAWFLFYLLRYGAPADRVAVLHERLSAAGLEPLRRLPDPGVWRAASRSRAALTRALDLVREANRSVFLDQLTVPLEDAAALSAAAFDAGDDEVAAALAVAVATGETKDLGPLLPYLLAAGPPEAARWIEENALDRAIEERWKAALSAPSAAVEARLAVVRGRLPKPPRLPSVIELLNPWGAGP